MLTPMLDLSSPGNDAMDGCSAPDGQTFLTDVCIIGGGPAGITLASELSGAGFSVILAESGGAKTDAAADALSDGCESSDQFASLGLYRRRLLGGATCIWGGRCVPYDPIDFEARDYVPYSGWPFGLDQLEPYYARATTYCEAGEPEYDSARALPGAEAFVEGFSSDIVRTNSYERFSKPTQFWGRYGGAILAAPNLRVITYATCVRLALGSDAKSVDHAEFATFAGTRFTIQARTFVVAAGGLETYRLLAASNDKRPAGLGNSSGALGRFLMSHIEGGVAVLRLNNPAQGIEWGFPVSRDGIYGRRRFSIAEPIQKKRRLLNFIARLHHSSPADPRHGDPVLSTMFMAKSFILAEYRRKLTMVERGAAARMPKGAAFWLSHVRNIVVGAPELAKFLADWIRRRHWADRAIPYVALQNRHGVYPLDFNAEQSPDPDNRVTLGETRDRFGTPVLKLDWKMHDCDVESIAGNLRIIRDEFAQSGVAVVDFEDRDLEEEIRGNATPIGGHHLGVARMSCDARQGVVDQNLRLHDVNNVYLASGAVFPTSSHANPTLTILALTIRLADHLKEAARSSHQAFESSSA
ncbi:FAD-dependent oxidoreductase [Methylocella silvestris]|uniref:GMC oxidoreductase n=1 Tax=Methylocella silvestris TaxID=199596 RepID=A0A2J7TDD0_METSI|nr:GMC family oxidoreductase [Methylocella silvestris]PNG24743.1 hypothetical protein CR492_17230 [Methylocella silvestris]